MRYIKWGFILAVLAVFASIAHYSLPQRDVVLIIDAYEKRMDVASNAFFWAVPDSGSTQQDTRDVRFIDTEYPDGSVMVFRNEDTGLGWPFFFKFDSSDVSAQAKQLISTPENPKWVAVRHYGWRSHLFSIFPNATSLKQVSGPDVKLFPWFNVILLVMLGLFALGIVRLLQGFKRRWIDPAVEDVTDAWDGVESSADSAKRSVSGFLARFVRWLRGSRG